MFQAIRNLFQKKDGLVNYNTNLGIKTANSFFQYNNQDLTDSQIEAIYYTNGLGARIVDIVVEDALRGFLETDVETLKELKRLKVKQVLTQVGCLGRLYGGAILVAFVQDARSMEKPLDERYIERVIKFKVFSRYQIHSLNIQTDYCTDPSSEFYGELEYFYLKNEVNASSAHNAFIKIHRSRCIILTGQRVSAKKLANSNDMDGLFNSSVLNRVYSALKNYVVSQEASTEILHDFIQTILKLEGLAQKMSTREGKNEINRRLRELEQRRSIDKTILLDGSDSETYEKQASGVGGLADVLDRLMLAVSAASGIPATRLFGDSPSGMNATGKGDLQCYYDTVRAYRAEQLEPAIDFVFKLLFAQKSWKNKPVSDAWEFVSLTAPTELEQAQIRKIYAEIDCLYIDRGAIDATEIAQERLYKDGKFHELPVVKPLHDEQLEVMPNNIDLLIDQPDPQKEEDKKVMALAERALKKVQDA